MIEYRKATINDIDLLIALRIEFLKELVNDTGINKKIEIKSKNKKF